jgi:glycosyltransferase involved in cell wall biosynthesis
MKNNNEKIRISFVSPSKLFKSGVLTFTLKIKEIFEERFELLHMSFYHQMPLLLYPGRKRVRETKKVESSKKNYEIINWFDIFSWKKAVNIIKKTDILYVPWWTIATSLPISYILKKSRKNGVKTIVEMHNVYDHNASSLMKITSKFILKQVVNNSNYIILHSQMDKEKLIKINKNAEKAEVIPLISFDFLIKSNYDKSNQREKLNISKEKIVLLMFGLVRKYKGLDYALQALRILKDRNHNIFLLVVGENWTDKNEILDIVNSLDLSDNFLWIDKFVPEEEISKYFAISDIALYPYTSACQSGSMQIAFSSSLPVVATKVGGFVDIITHSENGMLCNPKDSDGLANMIEEVINSKELQETVTTNALKNVENKYSIQNMRERYQSIIQYLINN